MSTPVNRPRSVRGGSVRRRAGFRRTATVAVAMVLAGLVAYVALHVALRAARGASPPCVLLCTVGGTRSVVDLLSAVAFVALAVVAAWATARRTLVRGYERPVVFGLLAYGLVSIPAAIVGLAGDAVGVPVLRLPYGAVLAALPSAALLVALHRRPVGASRTSQPPEAGHAAVVGSSSVGRPTALAVTVGAAAATLAVASIGVALVHPPAGFDELGYHLPLAVFFWENGTLTRFLDRYPGVWSLTHPGAAELWYGLLRAAGGEKLATLGQIPFAALGVVGVAAFARQTGLPRRAAFISGAGFLLVPMVALQLGRASNDVAAASVVVAVAALVAAPARDWTAQRVALIGLGVGLAAATKLAAIPEVVALVAVAAVTVAGILRAAASGARLPSHPIVRGAALAAALAMAATGPWWIRNAATFGNPLFPAAVPFAPGVSQPMLGMRDRDFVPHAALWPAYPWLEEQDQNSGAGTLFAAAVIPGVLLAIRFARRRALVVFAAVTIATLPAWWLATRHEPRFLLPLIALAMGFVPWVVAALRGRASSIAAALLATAAAVSVVVGVTSSVARYAVQPVDRLAFYSRLHRADPFVLALPESEPLLLDDQCGSYNRLYPYLGAGGGRLVARVRCRATTVDVLAALQRHGMRLVYATAAGTDILIIDRRYADRRFELVHQSVVPAAAGRERTERRLYRLTGG